MRILVQENIENINEEELLRLLAQLPSWRRQKVEQCRHHAGRCQQTTAFLLLQKALREGGFLTGESTSAFSKKSQSAPFEIPPFSYDPHGKPFLREFPDLHFNLSHCRHAVVCAVDSAPVGVDVETPRHASDGLLRYTMNEQEILQIQAAGNPDLAFSTLWTRKEAVLKLTGEGVGHRMHDILRPERLAEKGIVLTTSACDRFVYSVASFKRR